MSNITKQNTPDLTIWNINNQSKSMQNINKMRGMMVMQHGLSSGVPIMCKGSSCPFSVTCMIDVVDRVIGERCPVEIAAIIERFDRWCDALNIDPNDTKNTVDLGFVKDLVDIEIMMLRADNKMALDADFIEQVVSTVDDKGNVYYKGELHKATEIKERLRAEKRKILNELNSTRKNKENSLKGAIDASTQAATLMQRIKELQAQGALGDVIDVEVEETDTEVK